MSSVPLYACQDGQAALADVDVVHRREGMSPIEGAISQLSDAGVHVQPRGADRDAVLPWHTIREVVSEDWQDEWLLARPMADSLWRGVARLKRHDPALAASAIEPFFAQMQGQTHETALVIAEGTLRCALARASHEQAVLPWLEVVRLREAGVVTDAFNALPPIIDDATLLCPSLPPGWPDTVRLERLCDQLEAFDATGSSVVAALAKRIHCLALIESGNACERPKDSVKHPGVELLDELINLRLLDAGSAQNAIDRMDRRAATMDGWSEAWTRYSLGCALIRLDDRRLQDQGLVQLAFVPSRFRYAQPYLAGLSLQRMAQELALRGGLQRSVELLRLVQELYPGHPGAEVAHVPRGTEQKARP